MEALLCSFNEYVSSTFVSFISVNYFVAGGIVGTLNRITDSFFGLVSALIDGFIVIIQDLDVFIKEIYEFFVDIGRSAAEVIESFESLMYRIPLKEFYEFNSALISSYIVKTQNFFYLLGESLILTLYLIPNALGSLQICIKIAYDVFWKKEIFLGALTSILGIYLLYISIRLIRRSVPRIPPQVIFQFFCFLYLAIISIIIQFGYFVLRAAELTLNHIHLPSFNNIQEFEERDDEEEEEDSEVNYVDFPEVNTDDENESERIVESKRQRLSRIFRLMDGERDEVHEMLFQQVEIEREDKLCVVCQDKEKCIIILPCRHLCICQECKVLLLRGVRSCPICRKCIVQTIKAYL